MDPRGSAFVRATLPHTEKIDASSEQKKKEKNKIRKTKTTGSEGEASRAIPRWKKHACTTVHAASAASSDGGDVGQPRVDREGAPRIDGNGRAAITLRASGSAA